MLARRPAIQPWASVTERDRATNNSWLFHMSAFALGDLVGNLILKFGESRTVAKIAAAVFAGGAVSIFLLKLDLPWAFLWLAYGAVILIRFLIVTQKASTMHADDAVFDVKGFFTAIPEFLVPIALLLVTSDGFKFQFEDAPAALVGLVGALLGLIKRRPLTTP